MLIISWLRILHARYRSRYLVFHSTRAAMSTVVLLCGLRFLFIEDTATFIIPRGKGGYVMGLVRKIVALDWDTQEFTTLAEVEKKGLGDQLNDGKCDPAGRLWAGESDWKRAIVIQFNEFNDTDFFSSQNGLIMFGRGRRLATRALL